METDEKDIEIEQPSKLVYYNILKIIVIVWKNYDNEHGYVTMKLKRVYNIYKSNTTRSNKIFFMLQMFDKSKINEIYIRCSKESRKYLQDNNLFNL